jgi:hypothetical protein
MQRLRAGLRQLREAGVRRFVITADHGFLLHDEQTGGQVDSGSSPDLRRRHILSTVAATALGSVRVALGDLGYEGCAGQHLIMPSTTAVFRTGRPVGTFVHGGNSLQERVIPVLTIRHQRDVGNDNLRYGVIAEAREGVAQMHCLSGRVEVRSDGQLPMIGAREMELALRVIDRPEATVELCQVRGAARLVGAGVIAQVGSDFELFFRLIGPVEARVCVELWHPTGQAEVEPAAVEARFTVEARPAPSPAAIPAPPPSSARSTAWLDGLEAGPRQLFAHLAAHGVVTEEEAQGMLGGARALRRFSAGFEAFAARAPFGITIDTVGGVKRYVRTGGQG